MNGISRHLKPKSIRASLLSFMAAMFLTACIQDHGERNTPNGSKSEVSAGDDITVREGAWVILRGSSTNPSVLRWEWDLGNQGDFTQVAQGNISFFAEAGPRVMENVLRVTLYGNRVLLDTMRVTVLATSPFPLKALAGADTLVFAGDSLLLRGRLHWESDPPLTWEWDIGNTGVFKRAPDGDAIFKAGSTHKVVENVLKVTGPNGDFSLDTMRVTVALSPWAYAGKDTTVSISDSIWLRGKGMDRDGPIDALEWDIGNTGVFKQVDGDTQIVLGSKPGFQYHVLRVTDGKGNIALDTMRVTLNDDLPVVRLESADSSTGLGGAKYLKAVSRDLGRIVKWEWKLGSDAFREGGMDTVFHSKAPDGDTVRCLVRVTDDDGNTAQDSVSFIKSNWSTLGFASPLKEADRNGNSVPAYNAVEWNGKYYLAGTLESEYSHIRKAAAYDPESGEWSDQKELPFKLAGSALVNSGGTLYSIGGRPDNSLAGNGLVFEYMPAFSDWYRRRDMPAGLRAGSAAALDGRIHYIGFKGGNENEPFHVVPKGARTLFTSELRLETDTWETGPDFLLPNLPGEWRIMGTVVFGGKIQVYMVNGHPGLWIFEYSPQDKSWRSSGSLEGEAFEHVGAAAIGDRIYFMGAATAYRYTNWSYYTVRVMKMYSYRPATNVWEKRSVPGVGIYNAAPVAINGIIHAVADDYSLILYSPSEE